MKKSRVFGALGVAAAAFLGLGLTGTGAWFTDQEQTTVSADAATLSIDLRGPASLPIDVDNLLPGVETEEQALQIYNDSNDAAVKYRITSQNEAGDIIDKLRVRLRHGNCGGGPGGIASETYNEVFTATNLRFLSLDDAILSGGPDAEYPGQGVLEDNITHCFAISFFLAQNAGNSYQGTSGTFDIVVDATQPENPGFNE